MNASLTPTYDKLRRRLQAFVRHYVETGVGSRSLIAIKFQGSDPRTAACKLLKKPKIRQAIDELERTVREEMRERVVANVRGLEAIANWDPLWLEKPLADWPDEVRAAVQGIEVNELFEGPGDARALVGRKYKYRIASKIEARKLILQYQRVLEDRLPIAPVQVHVTAHGDAQISLTTSKDPIEASLEYERLMFASQPAELPKLPAPAP